MKVKHNLKTFKSQLKKAVDLKQTCKVYLTTREGSCWNFYFQQGYLIWASSSVHRFRRLYRLTNQVEPEINYQNIRLREQEISELWEYLLISILCQRQQLLKEQAQEIIHKIIGEVLIDCFLQCDHIEQAKTIFETRGNGMGAVLRSPLFKEPITKVEYKKTVKQRIELFVNDWHNLHINGYSPNFAPVIKDIDKLKKEINDEDYDRLFSLINGRRTLRDLAISTSQDTISLSCSLLPYLKNKAISLQEIPDQQLQNLYFSSSKNSSFANQEQEKRILIQELDLPLVIIVDDDRHICHKLTQILNPVGYRLISVNNAAQVLMILLENQPDLILLSAAMPDANGYELCTQIRSMPKVKNVPIVLLHQQANIMDKVKAKISGVSDSINKKAQTRDILLLVQKHTQNFVDQEDLFIL